MKKFIALSLSLLIITNFTATAYAFDAKDTEEDKLFVNADIFDIIKNDMDISDFNTVGGFVESNKLVLNDKEDNNKQQEALDTISSTTEEIFSLSKIKDKSGEIEEAIQSANQIKERAEEEYVTYGGSILNESQTKTIFSNMQMTKSGAVPPTVPPSNSRYKWYLSSRYPVNKNGKTYYVYNLTCIPQTTGTSLSGSASVDVLKGNNSLQELKNKLIKIYAEKLAGEIVSKVPLASYAPYELLYDAYPQASSLQNVEYSVHVNAATTACFGFVLDEQYNTYNHTLTTHKVDITETHSYPIVVNGRTTTITTHKNRGDSSDYYGSTSKAVDVFRSSGPARLVFATEQLQYKSKDKNGSSEHIKGRVDVKSVIFPSDIR